MRVIASIRAPLGSLLLTCLVALAAAQDWEAKKPLDHDVYDSWNSIASQSLSIDGRWVMYTLHPGKGDDTLVIQDTQTPKQYSVLRGSAGRISFDSQFAFYLVQPDPDAIKQARKDKKKPEELPKARLQILHLPSGTVTEMERVKSYAVPEEGSGWVACLLEKPLPSPGVQQSLQEPNPQFENTTEGLRAVTPQAQAGPGKSPEKTAIEKPAAQTSRQGGAQQVSGDGPEESKKEKEKGSTLVLRNLENGVEMRFPQAIEYRFSRSGDRLAWTTSADLPEEDGVFVAQLPAADWSQVLAGRGNYRQLEFDHAGKQLAFLTDRDDYESKQPDWSLYYWKPGIAVAQPWATAGSKGIPENWVVASNASPSFSKNGKRLFFGTAPRKEDPSSDEQQPDEGAAESQDDDDEEQKVNVDIWHWKDPELQTVQLRRAAQERTRSYRAAISTSTRRITQLASEDIPNVTIGNEQNADIAIGFSDLPYRMLRSWDSPGYSDVYLIDVASGEAKKILEKQQGFPQISPEGNYLAWWDADARAWFALSLKNPQPVNLTQAIGVPLHNEHHDTPSPVPAYGATGWMAGDRALLVLDRYDIWQLDPTGTEPARCLTRQFGRNNQLRFRAVQLDREARALDPDQPLLLSAFDDRSKASGYYRLVLDDSSDPQRLIMLDESIQSLAKAREAEATIFSRSSFRRFPDIWLSDTDFATLRQISRANPQQGDYRWGLAELVHWKSADGQELAGILYKPDGFDPGSKYPLMVYFYERFSDSLHRHHAPAPSRSSINFSFYVSRGYCVFVPDVVYKTGQPGQSALDCIVPGVEQLVAQGFIDASAMGMQGHSWGGYQVAYLVTRTNLFAAAEAGAPVSNMTSAYGGIRWSTGLSRMFQYERTQSRIGQSLWEARDSYLENSPVFFLDRVETPVLILHNDEDGAVPWYQGIEFFVALRRLGKPAWMLNYNGEAHGLTKWENQRDFAIRMQQFFDHYLQGAAPPVWLKEGVPAVDKGKTLGLELVIQPEAAPATSSENK